MSSVARIHPILLLIFSMGAFHKTSYNVPIYDHIWSDTHMAPIAESIIKSLEETIDVDRKDEIVMTW